MIKTTRKQNKNLCEKYPFLIPRNPFTGEIVQDYNYEYTMLDEIPDGWRIAFGEQLCEELRQELKNNNCLNNYHIIQIKEKYGELRWYDSGNTENGHNIIHKYEDISRKTCICCGKPATKITTGWISPYCDNCVPKNEKSLDINYYYADPQEL